RSLAKQAERKKLSASAMNIAGWIDNATVFEYFEVNMGASRAAGRTHQGDYLAFLYYVAHFYQIGFVVSVTGGVAPAMINLHHVAILWMTLRFNDDSRSNRYYVRAFMCCEINT